MTDIPTLERRLEQERLARLDAERVAEQTIRQLYDRQCEAQLLRSVAFAANEARSIDAAMRAAVESLCRYAEWTVGHVFFVEDGRLINTDIWHDETRWFDELRRRTEATAFGPGVGVPGHALTQELPVWLEDVAEMTDMIGERGLAELGLRAAVSVPVLEGTRVCAVLELFDVKPRPFNGHFVDIIGQVGAMLGRVVERERAQRELHEANNRLTVALVDLQMAQENIVQQERMRALGQMASGIAHDFNNALHPIVGYTELLLAEPGLEGIPEAARYLQHILTSANDAASVVGRLREFYRKREDEERLVPVDLRAIVTQVSDLTRPRWYNEALASGIRIAVVTELATVPPVMGNEAQLREACMNLVLNAVDAMPTGGTIVLRTMVEDDRVVVEVGDSGIGMTEHVRRQCLEPFFTTKGNNGSGLGLGMVYGIVQRHEGTLNIASAPGRGTTVSLGFPAARRDVYQPVAASQDALPPPLRILVVDDKPDARQLLCDMLQADGHTVEAVEKGLEGLTRLRRAAFDVVITDRSMPAMSGDELARVVRGSARPLPVIMITGFGVLMNSAGELPFGVDIVLPKPVTRAALREALESARIAGLAMSA